MDFTPWIQGTGFLLCQWNLDSGFLSQWDSGFLELYSGFQSPEIRNPQLNFSLIPVSGFRYMERCLVLLDFPYFLVLRYQVKQTQRRSRLAKQQWKPLRR